MVTKGNPRAAIVDSNKGDSMSAEKADMVGHVGGLVPGDHDDCAFSSLCSDKRRTAASAQRNVFSYGPVFARLYH